jgi:hypothetical protein
MARADNDQLADHEVLASKSVANFVEAWGLTTTLLMIEENLRYSGQAELAQAVEECHERVGRILASPP